MDTQEIIVYLIVLGCVGWILSHLFSFVKRTNKGESPCDSCATGCELRDLYKAKQLECEKEKETIKKNINKKGQ